MLHHFTPLRSLSSLTFWLTCAALLALPIHCRAQDQENDGAGAVISGKATAKDIGLPLYPGSKPHKDKDDDSAGANLGLWGGGSGFKLVVLKMESADSPEKVAAFYKKALSKYGPVLDCSHPPASPEKTPKDDSSTKTLTCGDDKPDKGGYLFKAGTTEKHRLVAIQPDGRGSTLYQLVNLGAWSTK
jgi:hypothetical protein